MTVRLPLVKGPATPFSGRGRLVAFGLVAGWCVSQIIALARDGFYQPGGDYAIYMERARSWIAGDGFYLPHQLAGPYPIALGDATYPPVALVLFAPMSQLPALLWWALPLAMIGALLWRLRPDPWILVLVALYPRTSTAIVAGNPMMWAFVALLAGLLWSWPSAFAAVKIPLGPFALVGIRRRAWWIGLAALTLLCLPFGSMWGDYVTAMSNARQTAALDFRYVLGDWPIAIGLLVAVGRRGTCAYPSSAPLSLSHRRRSGPA